MPRRFKAKTITDKEWTRRCRIGAAVADRNLAKRITAELLRYDIQLVIPAKRAEEIILDVLRGKEAT